MDSEEEDNKNFANDGGEALDLGEDFDSEEEVEDDDNEQQEEDDMPQP